MTSMQADTSDDIPELSTSSSGALQSEDRELLSDEAATQTDTASNGPSEYLTAPISDSADTAHEYLTNDNEIVRALTQYDEFGDQEHLSVFMDLARNAIQAVPISHRHWVYNWWYLRYQSTNALDDLEVAITVARQILELTSDEHVDKVTYLNNLGFCFRSKFNSTVTLGDLDQAVAAFRRVLDLTQEFHPDKPAHQGLAATNLGLALRFRYKLLSQPSDLENAIAALRRALELTPSGDTTESARLDSLGQSLCYRYGSSGNMDDLESALAMHTRAVDLTPSGHPNEPTRLNNLAHCLGRHFQHVAEIDSLERAITAIRRAIELTPDGDPVHPTRLNNLGLFLKYRFEHLGNIADLDQSIVATREAADLTLDADADKLTHLTNLSLSFHSRFKRLGNIDDLHFAVSTQERALALTPDGFGKEGVMLSNLCLFLQSRHNRTGSLEDLERAIEVQQRAVGLALDACSLTDKAMLYGTLATCLNLRFHRLGGIDDLENAIAAERCAIELAPHEDPSTLNNLGVLLRNRFDRLGGLDDLENAVTAHRRSIELTSDGHPDKAARLTNLGICLSHRFHRLEYSNDIEYAVALHSRAIKLTPDDHPDIPLRLSNLGHCLRFRFEHLGDFDALERAIDVTLRAVDVTPDDHPDQSSRLNNLGLYLFRRFDKLGVINDLERAIAYQRRAVELVLDSASIQPILLANLGTFLRARFNRLDDLDDLDEAVQVLRRAVNSTPEGHPGKSIWLSQLGWALKSVFLHEKSGQSFNEAVSCFLTATAQPTMTPDPRFETANMCVQLVEEYPEFGSASILLQAHSRILDMIPELVWLGHSITRRLQETRRLGNLVSKAVSSAIDAMALQHAVEYLEAGRGLIWSQILSLRSPLDDLAQHHPALAHALVNVQAELRGSVHASYRADSTPLNTTREHNSFALLSSAEMERHRWFSIEYGRILADIRCRPGFENFMRPRTLAALQPSRATISGPVIFINASEVRCDAVILSPDEKIEIVPLLELTYERATKLRSEWGSCLRHRGVRDRASIAPQSRRTPGSNEAIISILSLIWKWIIHPVLQSLDFIGIASDGRLPHITWCPTGPLTQLPIHAAGVYGKVSGPRVYDFVVSSYTSSLSALSRCYEAVASRASNPSVLIVTQPDAPGLTPLPGTVVEGQCLRDRLSKSEVAFTSLNGKEATADAVRSVLEQHPWIHLACHGSQHLADPVQSAFALYDGPLSLANLMATAAENAELAFLSACQTAVGDGKTPEESMHLAAGMLAVGFKGVIATMWSIQDDDAPLVVEAYYETLIALRKSGSLRMGETGAAFALHEAMNKLREKVGDHSFMRWAPFVHFGA